MDEDEKIEMRGNQHRTKPSFGIRARATTQRSCEGYHGRVTAMDGRMNGRAWKGDGMVTGQWA